MAAKNPIEMIHNHNMYANEHVKMTYFSHVYVMEGLFILIVSKNFVLSHLALILPSWCMESMSVLHVLHSWSKTRGLEKLLLTASLGNCDPSRLCP